LNDLVSYFIIIIPLNRIFYKINGKHESDTAHITYDFILLLEFTQLTDEVLADLGCEYFIGQLRELKKKYEVIGDVRGIGLMLAIDFVKDPVKRDYNYEVRNKVIQEAFKRGLVCLAAGKSAIRFAPPLTLKEEHVDVAVEIMDESIKAALG